MAINVVLNGVTYSIPEPGNDGWGQSLTDYFVAQASGLLQKAGGTFSLTAEVDFGTTYGLKSAYFKSRAASPATSGQVRLGNAEGVYWRNAAGSANLGLLVNASDQLEFNGTTIQPSGNYITSLTGAVTATGPGAAATTISAGAIVNSMISASAAIARSKIASGTASHVVINDGSGVLSSEATLAKSRGGTGADNSSVTFPSSGSIATVPSSGVVKSNGTVLSSASVNLASEVTGTLPLANGGTGQTAKTAAFDALSPTTTAGDLIVNNGTNNVRFAIGSDGQVPVVDTSLTNKLKWATLPTGTKNYITYGTFENNATTGWNKLTVGAVDSTTKAVSGSVTLSAAGITTFATTATNPLAGTYSLSAGNASSALTVTEGIISDAYTIDREDKAKVLGFKFYFEPKTGASNANWSGTTSNTLAVWIYDTANSAWIQPSGSFGLTQSSGVGICQGTFQTPSNMTSFRIALVCINAPSGALVLNLDDVTVGPQIITQGTPVTDWQAYTPTFAGLGTVTGIDFKWRRVGDSIQILGAATTGTTTGSTASFTLPSGLSNNLATTFKVGTYGRVNANAEQHAVITQAADKTKLYFGVQTGTQADLFTRNGNEILSGEYFTVVTEAFPVQGWSSQVQMSSDTDTRIVEAIIGLTSNYTTTANSPTKYDTIVKDSHGAYSTSTGLYTVPVSGFYSISSTFYSNTNTCNVALFVNGTKIKYIHAGTTVGVIFSGSTDHYCNAGDTIAVGSDSSGVVLAGQAQYINHVSIKRISGPSQIAQSESVNAKYNTSAAQSIANTGEPIVDFGTKVYDSHGAVTTGASWKFTAPISGKYSVRAACHFNNANWGASTLQSLRVYKNGSADDYIYWQEIQASMTSRQTSVRGSTTVQLNAGEYIDVRISQNDSGSRSLSSATNDNYVVIERVGNY